MAGHLRLIQVYFRLEKELQRLSQYDNMLQFACWCNNLTCAEFCIRHSAAVNAFPPLSDEILLVMTGRVFSVKNDQLSF